MFEIWVKSAAIRAIKTFAQTVLALIGGGYVAFGDVDWIFTLSVSGVAALLSICTSIAGLPEVDAAKEIDALIYEDFGGLECDE